MKKYKIVVDENVALPEAFELFGIVSKIKGREITNDSLKDCEILIVRSVTKVDEELLRNTFVKFVGTATSGTDHIDTNYLKQKNIFFASAKGCNSYAVAEYVIIALTKLLSINDDSFDDKSIGIIGYGSIGSKVAKMCQSLGMKVIINDPPLKRQNPSLDFYPLEEILNCDIISLHIPLTLTGEDKTYNLLDENLNLLKDKSVLINTSRGGVVNEKKLIEILRKKRLNIVNDVWINEPDINIELLSRSLISTPHIAGYSIEGKINGSKMIFEQLNSFLATNIKFDFINQPEIEVIKFDRDLSPKNLYELFKRIYDIENDSLTMKKMLDMKEEEKKYFFEYLRKNYLNRKSFNNYLIKTTNKSLKPIFESLRFQVEII